MLRNTINLLITFNLCNRCKRFNGLGLNGVVLSKASAETFAVKPNKWSPPVHRFLLRCSDAGNAEASYTLGMVIIYYFLLFSFHHILLHHQYLPTHLQFYPSHLQTTFWPYEVNFVN